MNEHDQERDRLVPNRLLSLMKFMLQKFISFIPNSLSKKYQHRLLALSSFPELASRVASDEGEPLPILHQSGGLTGVDRLIDGIQKFKREMHERHAALFKTLESVQNPHTLLITCSDSRIDPNLITSSDPGELFVVRNVGNLVPPHDQKGWAAEAAALEFAVGFLGVQDIVVCSHSSCGAMKAVLKEDFFSEAHRAEYPHLVNWLDLAACVKKKLGAHPSLEEVAKENALLQLEHLKSYDWLRKKWDKKELRLHAWYYDIGKAELDEWSEEQKSYVRIGDWAV